MRQNPKLRYSFDEIVLEGLSKKLAGRNVILEIREFKAQKNPSKL